MHQILNKGFLTKQFSTMGFCFLIGVVLGGVGLVSAEVLTTTDVESGNSSGWTALRIAGGKGFPSVAVCDHASLVSSSRCLKA